MEVYPSYSDSSADLSTARTAHTFLSCATFFSILANLTKLDFKSLQQYVLGKEGNWTPSVHNFFLPSFTSSLLRPINFSNIFLEMKNEKHILNKQHMYGIIWCHRNNCSSGSVFYSWQRISHALRRFVYVFKKTLWVDEHITARPHPLSILSQVLLHLESRCLIFGEQV